MTANINAIVLCDLNEKIILCHVSFTTALIILYHT